MDIKTVQTFDYALIARAGIQKRPKGNQGTKHNKKKYKNKRMKDKKRRKRRSGGNASR